MNRRKSNSLQLSGSFLFANNYQQQSQSQYRATQLWHNSLGTFVKGVPLAQHRSLARFWKSYEDSFTGAEAVTWFHEQLKSSCDRDISREQTKKLLGKFYRAGVFVNVELEGSLDHPLDEKDFRDSQLHIYRLTMARPGSKKSPSPKKDSPTSNKLKKNYSVEIQPLSMMQMEEIYFNLLLEKLVLLVSTPLNPPLLHTGNILLNLQPNSPPTQTQSLPSWILPAMKYLANYPDEAHLHVEYPNFENDVFFLVVDYFEGFCKRHGLLIDNHFHFLTAMLNIHPQIPAHLKYEAKFPFPKSEFEEIDQIFTPKSQNARRFVMGRNRRQMFNDAPSPAAASSQASLYQQDVSVNVKPMGILDTSRYQADVYFATSFDVKSPVTRVLSQSELYAYDNPNLNLSPIDLINHPKYGKLRRRLWPGKKSLSVGDLAEESDDDGGFGDFVSTSTILPSPAPETKRPTIQALSLLLLTLDPVKRKHLEALLRFFSKVSDNAKLRLDVAVANKDVLLDCVGRHILKSHTSQTHKDLILFMASNVDVLFSEQFLAEFREQAENLISEKQVRKVAGGPPSSSPSSSSGSSSTKENKTISQYCSKISMHEYEHQRLLGETASSLRNLLDVICKVENEKMKKKQLKKFQKEYPHIYAEKFSNTTAMNESSLDQSQFQQQRSNKKRTPFGILI